MLDDLVDYGLSGAGHNSCKIRFFEARTGSGKTIVALMAAIEASSRLGGPVVISTANNQLLAQARKEAAQFLPSADGVAFIMGMSNYVAASDVEALVAGGALDPQALAWLGDPGEGLVSGLEAFLKKEGARIPRMLKSHVGIDPRRKDADGEYRKFFNAAVARAMSARVVVTNHAVLLMSYFVGEGAHLPAYRFLILDEAPDVAMAARLLLSTSFSPWRTRNLAKVVLGAMEAQAGHLDAQGDLIGKIRALQEKAEKFSKLQDSDLSDTSRILSDLPEHVKRLRSLERTAAAVRALVQAQLPAIKAAKLSTPSFWNLLTELAELHDTVSMGLDGDRVLCVYSSKEGRPSYQGQRQDPYWALQKRFWRKLSVPAALLSGVVTLVEPGSDNSFNEYVLGSLGIGGDVHRDLLCRSWVEDYSPETMGSRIALDYVDEHFPAPSSWYPEEGAQLVEDEAAERDRLEWLAWTQAVGERVAGKYLAKPGKTLVLVGSYRDAKAIADRIVAEGVPEGKVAKSVKGSDAHNLSRAFEAMDHGVMVGTRQHWTGLDVRGIDRLAIARMPFPVLGEYRWQRAKGQGWMWPKYLWETVMAFRQGCGRLIRAVNQAGEIDLMDSRVFRRTYVGWIDASRWKDWAGGNLAKPKGCKS
jgi:Rad3-related DNA helicase